MATNLSQGKEQRHNSANFIQQTINKDKREGGGRERKGGRGREKERGGKGERGGREREGGRGREKEGKQQVLL